MDFEIYHKQMSHPIETALSRKLRTMCVEIFTAGVSSSTAAACFFLGSFPGFLFGTFFASCAVYLVLAARRERKEAMGFSQYLSSIARANASALCRQNEGTRVIHFGAGRYIK